MIGNGSQDQEPRAKVSRRLVLATTVASVLSDTTAAGAQTPGPHRPGAAGADHRTLVKPVPTTAAHWQGVADVLGHPGKMAGESTYDIAFPRGDLKVVSFGHIVRSIAGHISFIRYADGQTMMMGDLVCTESEMQKVFDRLIEHGIGQTALHKHLLCHQPDLWWSHIHAIGRDEVVLARGLRAALDATGTLPMTRTAPRPPADPDTDAADGALDTDAIDRALGTKGHRQGDGYKVTFARNETIAEHGRILPRMAGSTTALIFQPAGDGKALLNGDFAMTAGEVQPVLGALRHGGIGIVSLHSHMLSEEPRLFFAHLWAVQDAVHLARTLRSAVAHTNVSPASPG
jgi:Domain of Unknown Function (DUF1259)